MGPGTCRYAGKGQSDLGMLGTLWDLFRPGGVLPAERLTCAWTEVVMLGQRGVECVCRFTSHRKADFRRGERVGERGRRLPLSFTVLRNNCRDFSLSIATASTREPSRSQHGDGSMRRSPEVYPPWSSSAVRVHAPSACRRNV